MKIKKGNDYECVKTVVMDDGDVEYVKGRVYLSELEHCLTDESGIISHFVSLDSSVWAEEHFKKVTSNKSLKKRVEALEKQVRQVRNLNVANSIIETTKNICDSFKVPPKPETIYVPDGILDDDGDILNGKHCLHYCGGWQVSIWNCGAPSTPNQFKLVPCKREDLKVGEVAFSCDYDEIDPSVLESYCIILDEGCQHWSDKDCMFDDEYYNHWYKIVEA
jgi:hypothetical protein